MFNRKVLMCPPTYFEVSYKINPWMDPKDQSKAVKHLVAIQQWRDLHHLIIRLGGYVEESVPVRGLPDMCFTANAGLYHDNKAVVASFAHKERAEEASYFEHDFRRQGYEVMTCNHDFEGAGDAFVIDETLFLGCGFRTDRRVATDIMDFLGLKSLVLCELVDPHFYHLDTCFCPLGNGKALYYPGAFSPGTLRALNKTKLHLIEADESDAKRFACNAVVMRLNEGRILFGTLVGVESHVILPAGCERTASKLMNNHFYTHMLPMDQFLKAGGACKCLTLQMSEHKGIVAPHPFVNFPKD